MRGITLERIHRNIQLYLKQLSDAHSYPEPSLFATPPGELSQDEALLIRNARKPWIKVTSNAIHANKDGSNVRKPNHIMGIVDQLYDEGSILQPKPGNLSYREDYRMTPPPGVTGINISTKGTLGSIKTADINFWCPTEMDLQDLEFNFMTPGITVLVEWGWSGGVNGWGSTPLTEEEIKSVLGKPSDLEKLVLSKTLGTTLLTGDGDYKYINPNEADSNTLKTFNPLKEGVGSYDAMLGVITKFNWSLNNDGSYNASTSLIAPNTMFMGAPLTTGVYGGRRVEGNMTYKWVKKMPGKDIRLNGNGWKKKFIKDGTEKNTPMIDAEVVQKALMLCGYTQQKSNWEKEFGLADFAKKARDWASDPDDETPEKVLKFKNFNVVMEDFELFLENMNWPKLWFRTSPFKSGIKKKYGTYTMSVIYTTAQEFQRGGQLVRRRIWKDKPAGVKNAGWCLGVIGWAWDKVSMKTTRTLFWTIRGIEELLMKTAVPRNEDGNPVISFTSTQPVQAERGGEGKEFESVRISHHPAIISFDPSVCYIPWKIGGEGALKQFHQAVGDEISDDIYESVVSAVSTKKNIYTMNDASLEPWLTLSNDMGEPTVVNSHEMCLSDILVNSNHVIKLMKQYRRPDEFWTQLLGDINDACGKPWDFVLKASPEDSSIIQIQDNNWTSISTGEPEFIQAFEKNDKVQQGIAAANEKLSNTPDEDHHQVWVDGKHLLLKGKGQGNIIRDIKLNSKLPKLMQTAAFMANSGRKDTKSGSEKDKERMKGMDAQAIDSFYNPTFKFADHQTTRDEAMKRKKTFATSWMKNVLSLVTYGVEENNSEAVAEQMIASVMYDVDSVNAQKVPFLLPLELELTLDGIAGIYQGNGINFCTIQDGGIIPDRYKDRVVFQVTQVSNSLSDTDWTTTLKCMMRMSPAKPKLDKQEEVKK